ncbi:DNA topoisomerase IV subunit A [Aeromonas sp. 23P]|uniref:DNA topoisomerase IV subunit A n=1 Tax=Aeromonas sp. 23P TaxID=3452716 RepID=UPI003F7907D8
MGNLEFENISDMLAHVFAQRAYMSYAEYVIMDRSLPSVKDGLKPVHRRILYAMSELGLHSGAKYKKSARAVGDVLGKYHPHGDSACYEAMVLMSQSFNTRYPLVDGQGNWGSQDDPKSFAAMRYTESKLTRYASSFDEEMNEGVVEFTPNFDSTLKEPQFLPARLPNILLNGTSGIAVGLATDVPSHNMREVVNALFELIDNKDATLRDVLNHIQGPDLACPCEIVSTPENTYSFYETGRGSFKARSIWHSEGDSLVITGVPLKSSPAKIMEGVAKLVNDKTLLSIDNIRDESDEENPVRIVLKCLKGTDHDKLMDFLNSKKVGTEKTMQVNMNIIGLNKTSQMMGLMQILTEWLSFRRDTVRRKFENRLRKVNDQLHIIDGFIQAYLNLDEVIRIIRESDNPKQEMMDTLGLTEIQTEAVLDTKLRNLAKLEEMALLEKRKKLMKDKESYEKILSTDKSILKQVRKELAEDCEKYTDNRICQISHVDTSARGGDINSVMIPEETLNVVISQMGWIRTSKGDIDGKTLSYKPNDGFKDQCVGSNLKPICLIDNTGRAYNVMPTDLPNAKGYGDPITKFASLKSQVNSMTSVEESAVYFVGSSAGYGYRVNAEDLVTKHTKGKVLLTVPDSFEPIKPIKVDESDKLLVLMRGGEGKVIEVKNAPILNKGKGNRFIMGPTVDNPVIFVGKVNEQSKVTIFDEEGRALKTLTWNDLSTVVMDNARRGKKLLGNQKKAVARVEVTDSTTGA